MADLIKSDSQALDPQTVARARDIIERNTPANTRRSRESALRYFWAWAGAHGLAEHYPVHADVLVRFIIDHHEGLDEQVEQALLDAGAKRKRGPLSVATIELRVRHLSAAHKAQGLDSPAADPRVRELLKRLKRERAQGPPKKRPPTDLQTFQAILATCGESLTDIRDRALLLVGAAAGGRRRSEIVAMNVEDLEVAGDDYLLTIRRSKTDQEGHGLVVPVKGRAAKALRTWLDASGIDSGPLFRALTRWGHVKGRLSDDTVLYIVRHRAELAGFDPETFSAHWLRALFMTVSGLSGVPIQEAMALSGHKTVEVASRYYRAGDALSNRAGTIFG